MGHYRPPRPKLNEDPMQPAELLYERVDRIKQGKFTGFSQWTPGVPTPKEHSRRREGRLRALNRGVEPRFGLGLDVARNHSRYIHGMVNRIKNQHSSTARSRDPANVNMHPVFLHRPIKRKKRKKAEINSVAASSKNEKRILVKRGMEWLGITVIDWFTSRSKNSNVKKLASVQYPSRVRKHRPGEIVVRKGTPFCYTPRLPNKLIDGTHLCARNEYDDSKAQKAMFSGADNHRMQAIYKEVMDNPKGLAPLTPRPWKPPLLHSPAMTLSGA